MAANIRRNTFVVSDIPPAPLNLNTRHISNKDRQNMVRLKVNRIALVQELRVEHITDYLKVAGVLTDSDLRAIDRGRTDQDRARMLVDILPTKTNITNWYKNFRDSLLNPQGGNVTKQRYRFLVEFLDNTLIHRPSSPADRLSEARKNDQQTKYPRFDPLPDISEKQKHPVDVLNLENEKEESTSIKPPSSESAFTNEVDDTINSSISLKKDSRRSMVLVKGLFHQWIPVPNNFRSLLDDLPNKPAQNITEEANPHDVKERLQRERRAITILRKIEVTLALARRRQLPPGFEFCTCDAVLELLSERDAFHLYLKHVRALQEADVYIVKEICASFQSVLGVLAADPASEMNRQTVTTGFRLVDLLTSLEMFPQAEEMLVAIINFLNVNSGLETWMSEYSAHVRLMGVRNDMCELNEAQRSYFSATQLKYQIELVSFGQRLVFEGRLHKEMSAMLLENGSITSALGWARQALQEVDPNDHESVIEVLSHAVLAHCASWQVKKAEELAVFAVQLAREKYGKLHPLYLKALHSLCHFCNEFKQDSTGVELAKELVELTRKTYKCETLHLAQAHRVFSKALMAQQDFHNSNSFYHHAMEAIRIARSLLLPGHPMLHPFLSNFAMALQWKSLSCPEEVRVSTLSWAETEARQALRIVSMHHGEISLRAAQIYILLGQILSKMNKLEEAEKHLMQSVDYLKLCQPPTSNYLLLAHATLGTFFKVIGKLDKAVFHLKQVVMLIEPCGYLKWVHVCFETLIELLQAGGKTAGASSEDINRLQAQLSLWLTDNPKDDTPVNTTLLSSSPSSSFQDFRDKFDSWVTAFHKVHRIKDSTLIPKPSSPTH